MKFIDQGDGRVITVYYKLKLSPPNGTPVGDDTIGAEKIAEVLQTAGSEAIRKLVDGQGYDAAISTAYFIF